MTKPTPREDQPVNTQPPDHDLPPWALAGTEYAYGTRIAHGTVCDSCDQPPPGPLCSCGHPEDVHTLGGCPLCPLWCLDVAFPCTVPWTALAAPSTAVRCAQCGHFPGEHPPQLGGTCRRCDCDQTSKEAAGRDEPCAQCGHSIWVHNATCGRCPCDRDPWSLEAVRAREAARPVTQGTTRRYPR